MAIQLVNKVCILTVQLLAKFTFLELLLLLLLLNIKYYAVDQFEKTEMGRAYSSMRERRCVYCIVLVGKPEGKRPLGRLGCRWEDNIKRDLQEVGWRGMEIIDMAQDRDRWRAR